MAQFPLRFESFQNKHEINLRVLRRCFSAAVMDYTLVIPEVSVYSSWDQVHWKRLQISGPLFVLQLNGCPAPVLFLMNNHVFKNTKDWWMKVPGAMQLACESNKLYMRSETTAMLIATDNDRDARALAVALRQFQPVSIDGHERDYRFASLDDDPSMSHILRSLE